jgi:predicted transcriptional regulator
MRECVSHHHACDCREAQFAEIKAERDSLRALLTQCAPHVLASAEAEHLLDGFRRQARPLDDLANRVREVVATNHA